MEKQSLYIKRVVDGEEQYFPSNTERAVIGTFTYNAKRMGSAPTIEATLKYPRCLDDEWTHTEYVEFGGKKLYVSQVPTSSKNNETELYEHSITFVDGREVLENVLFLDVVTDNTETAYKDRYRSDTTEFSFSGDIKEFVARVNDSLEYSGLYDHETGEGYHIVIDDGISSDVAEVSIENQYITEVLQEIYNTYNLCYYWVGEVCHVGYTENVIITPIKYGDDNELLKVEKQNTNERIVDRITGHGGEDNIPWYYPNANPSGTAVFETKNIEKSAVASIDLDKVLLWNVPAEDTYTLRKVAGTEAVANIIAVNSLKYNAESSYSKTVMLTDDKEGITVNWGTRRVVLEFYSEPLKIKSGTIINTDGISALINDVMYVKSSSGNTKKVNIFSEEFENKVAVVEDDTGSATLFHPYPSKTEGVITDRTDVFLSYGTEAKEISLSIKERAQSFWVNESSVDYDLSNGNSVVDTDITAYLVIRKIVEYSFRVSGVFWQNWIKYEADTPYLTTSDGYTRLSDDKTFEIRQQFAKNTATIVSGSGNSEKYSGSGIVFADLENTPAINVSCEWKYNDDTSCWEFEESVSGEDEAAQVIIAGRKWIEPSKYLMPSIYRESEGAERFYNAVNDKYEIPDESGDKYTFNNLYLASNPHEYKEDFEDIYPTINGLKNANGELIGEIADIAFDSDDSDVLKDNSDEYKHQYFYVKLHIFNGEYGFNLFAQASATDEATLVMKSGNCSTCAFPIRVVKRVNSDGTAYTFHNPVATDDNGKLKKVQSSDSSGYLGDYIYNNEQIDSYTKRQQSTYSYEVWIACQKEDSTFGVLMPNAANNYRPQKGDLFVLTGIDMPGNYIYAAEKKLEQYLIKYMKANNDEKFTFNVSFSRIFLAKNKGFADMLNENARLLLEYNGQQYSLYVSNYTCKADDNILYDVECEITDELSVQQSTVRTQIDAVKSDIMSTVGSIDFLKAGAKYFLRKDVEDTAAGRPIFENGVTSKSDISTASLSASGNVSADSADIASGLTASTIDTDSLAMQKMTSEATFEKIITFLKGFITELLRSSSFDEAGQIGFSIDRMNNGRYKMFITNLEVWGKAVFNQLEVRKLSYVGGNVVFSSAGSIIKHVNEQTDDSGNVTGWKCYLLSDDGTTATQNTWVKYDQARCQTFNVGEGTTSGAENKYYWRLVTDVSTENEILYSEDGSELYNGMKFGWIVLSASDYDTTSTDVPAVGDTIVQMGNRNIDESTDNTSRQNLQEIVTSGEEAAPYFASFKGINQYELPVAKRIALISADGVNFNASSFTWTYRDGSTSPVKNTRGAWSADKTPYYYYDEVSYDGQMWLCITGDTTGVSSVPSEDSSDWQLEVAKGEQGKTGATGSGVVMKGEAVKHTGIFTKVDKDGIYLCDVKNNSIRTVTDGKSTTSASTQGDTYHTTEDGHLWSWDSSVNKWTDLGKVNGEQGEQGIQGEAAWTFHLSDGSNTISLSDLTENQAHNFNVDKQYTVESFYGENKGTVAITGVALTNCMATTGESGAFTLNHITGMVVTDDDGNPVTDASGNEIYIPYGIACVSLAITASYTDADGVAHAVTQTVPVQIVTAYTKQIAKFYYDNTQFVSQIAEIKSGMDGYEKQMTEIEQTSKSIGLFVSQSVSKGTNLIKDSLLHSVWNTQAWPSDAAARYVSVIRGKTYTLSAWFRTEGGSAITVGLWSEEQQKLVAYVTTEAATLAQVDSTFTPDTTERLRVIWDSSANDGAVYVDRVQLIEGEVALPWSLSQDDPEANTAIYTDGDFTCDGIKLSNVSDGCYADTNGDALTTYYYDNTAGNTYHDMLYMNGVFTPESGCVYTLSFWAKGSGTIHSYLYSNAAQGSYNGDTGEIYIGEDGMVVNTLTDEWQRFKCHFTASTSITEAKKLLAVRLLSGAKAYAAGVKFERGGRATEYGLNERMLSTGIDIRHKKIAVTSDQFVIQNNSGEVTAKVNKDGVLECEDIVANGGTFSGIVQAYAFKPVYHVGVLYYYADNGEVEDTYHPDGTEETDTATFIGVVMDFDKTYQMFSVTPNVAYPNMVSTANFFRVHIPYPSSAHLNKQVELYLDLLLNSSLSVQNPSHLMIQCAKNESRWDNPSDTNYTNPWYGYDYTDETGVYRYHRIILSNFLMTQSSCRTHLVLQCVNTGTATAPVYQWFIVDLQCYEIGWNYITPTPTATASLTDEGESREVSD